MIRAFANGIGSFSAGLQLLNQPGLRRFVAIPLLINVLLFSVLIGLVAGQFGNWIDSILPELPSWLSWLSWLLWLVFSLVMAVVVFFSFTVVANLVAAPFNALLAEAVEKHLTGQALPGNENLVRAVMEFPAALLDEARKIGYFALWAVPLLILFLIPVLQVAAPVFWALFGAWMLALEYFDYPAGNHQLRFAAQRACLRKQRWMGLGFGGAVMLATLIPLVNFLVMPAAVAGATHMWVRHLAPEQAKS